MSPSHQLCATETQINMYVLIRHFRVGLFLLQYSWLILLQSKYFKFYATQNTLILHICILLCIFKGKSAFGILKLEKTQIVFTWIVLYGDSAVGLRRYTL